MTVNNEKIEKSIENKSELNNLITKELDRLGNGTWWMWKLFLICAIPNILNGFHISSYVFLGQKPDYWCLNKNLVEYGWSPEEIKNITARNLEENGSSCNILNVDYNKLNGMTYDEALNYTNTQSNLEIIACTEREENYFHYEQEPDVSIVPEWSLICENNVLRSTVQVIMSVGKLIGGPVGGFIADKYGRKKSVIFGSICFCVGSFLSTVSPWYWLFIIARLSIGIATSCIYFPSYTILSENVSPKYRSWLCLAHIISYPIGIIILSLLAYIFQPWRSLQFALSVPSILLPIFCYVMFESPRWLLSKGREIEAYKIVFKKEPDTNLLKKSQSKIITEKQKSFSISDKIKEIFNEYISLYGPAKIRKRALICHFNWCVAAMSYYITAINSDNISANKYIYVAVTGLVDIPGYFTAMFIVHYAGRKIASCTLYFIAAFSFLIVLSIPRENVSLIVFFAMFGRFAISAAYAVTTLHTSEMFPTEIRNTALGASSTIGDVGGISAPYIVDLLGLIAWYIPTTICGVSVLMAGILTIFQPETKNITLKDHLEDE